MGLIVAGVAGSQNTDTSGEILDIEGCDLSSFIGSHLNTEHINPQDIGKDESKDGFDGFSTIVGRVLAAKKIFSDKDCDDDMQRQSWDDLKVPFIWVKAEIFDDENGHDNAKAAGAIIRHHILNKDKYNLDNDIGFSVEGQTIKRDGDRLTHTILKSLALTAKPANKAATIKQILPQDGEVQKSEHTSPNLQKVSHLNKFFIVNQDNPQLNPTQLEKVAGGTPELPASDPFGLKQALENLRKTMTAGGYNAAPAALVGGSALQKEDHLATLSTVFGNKPITRASVKKALPSLKDKDVKAVILALKRKRLKKTEEEYANIYQSVFKK
jgi:hypothetical protein